MPFDPSIPIVAATAVFVGVSVAVGSFMAASDGWRAAVEAERFPFATMRTSGATLGGVRNAGWERR